MSDKYYKYRVRYHKAICPACKAERQDMTDFEVGEYQFCAVCGGTNKGKHWLEEVVEPVDQSDNARVDVPTAEHLRPEIEDYEGPETEMSEVVEDEEESTNVDQLKKLSEELIEIVQAYLPSTARVAEKG